MRLMLILPFLALAACFSASPTHERGAYRPPAPAHTRPGVGLPVPGQPRHVPTMEPAPRPPPLPQTPKTRAEPTIWASTPPEEAPAVTFDWNVPLPENDSEASAKIKACVAIMRAASARGLFAHESRDFDKVNINWRMCWPHAAVARCLDGLKQETSATSEHETLQRAGDFARKAVADTCSGGAGFWSPGFVQALERVWGAR